MKKLLFTLLLLISSSANAQFNGMWFEESLAQSPNLIDGPEFKEQCLKNKDWCAGFIAGVAATNQYAYKSRDTGGVTEFSSAVCTPNSMHQFLQDSYNGLYRGVSADAYGKGSNPVMYVEGFIRGKYDCISNGHKNLWSLGR